MGRVAILPPAVADQIAAGEVVERPASVVKELVENALDAEATAVTIELEGGGRSLIRVSDDGVGMDRADAELALERHATSKIRAAPDLIGVATYGFRGEALPAIASVAVLELETAPRDGSAVGTRIRVRGGRREMVADAARAPGTTVTVQQLFFNTPARRKFLRSQRSETRAVVEAVTVLALARLEVGFTLISDGRVLIEVPPARDLLSRIVALFGRSTAAELLPVDEELEGIRVHGFVQRPADVRPAGRRAYLFVNGRPFRDPLLLKAAEAGYRATLPVGLRPTVMLAMDVAGDRVDMNVHPAKLEVRFRDRFAVERALAEAVRRSLRPMEAAAVLGAGGAGVGAPGTAEGVAPAPDSGVALALGLGIEHAASFIAPSSRWDAPGTDVLQVFETYLVFQTPEGLAIVDQHSAHERILYERVMRELRGEGSAAQRLLLPITVDLTQEELEAAEVHRDLLEAVGYELEPFGGRSLVLHAVPNPHPRFDARRCFEELVGDLARARFGSVPNRLERFAATYACRAAIKAGQVLDAAERRELLHRLFLCALPPHDVHGRPTIVQLPRVELERRFARA